MKEKLRNNLRKYLTSNIWTQSTLFLITNIIQDSLNLFPFKNSNKGVIMLTFDDGFESVYSNAFPIMKDLNIVGNVAVITDKIGSKNYMTLKQLLELQQAGWSIVSHSKAHPDISQLSKTELLDELEGSKNILKKYGFIGYHTFIVPFHYFDTQSMISVRKTYSISRNRSQKSMQLFGRFGLYRLLDYPLSKKHDLPSLPIEDFYNIDEGLKKIKSYIKYSVKKQKYGAMYTHGLNNKDKEAFRRIIEFMSNYKDNVITFQKLM